MDQKEVCKEFAETFLALEATITKFDHQNFNNTPFDGSWTAAQVVQHIILASNGFAGVLNAEVQTTERAFDKFVPLLKSDFLNFEHKMKSPDFIKPKLQVYDRDELWTTIRQISSAIEIEIRALDLSKTCLAFELPVYGFLTRLEAIYFVIYHTQRHIHQLDEIHRFLSLS